jgi:hypothetical protein
MKTRSAILASMILLLAGCVSVNKTVLNRQYMTQPVAKEDVHVFFSTDTLPPHERIAILNAKGDEAMTDEADMIDKMRKEAGKLGANAIVLNEVREPSTGAKVASAVLGTTANRKGTALAIYAPSLVKPRQGSQ